MVKILFLAADPTNLVHNRLNAEFREIQNQLQASLNQANIDLRISLAVRPIDLTNALQRDKPQIVHFSGHGSSHGEIFLEDQAGLAQAVSPQALAAAFAPLKKSIQCVVLNACYSQLQAEAISKHIAYVVGMKDEISDPASIAFSSGFYQALGNGLEIPAAFEFGKAQVGMQYPQELDIPELMTQEIVALSQAAAVVNTLADPVRYVLTNTPDPKDNLIHGMTLEGRGSMVVSQNSWMGSQKVDYKDLEPLSPEIRRHIFTYREAMERQYEAWQKLYGQRGLTGDPKEDQKVERQLKKLVRLMKEAYLGIMQTLDDAGFQWDDHFEHVRTLIRQA